MKKKHTIPKERNPFVQHLVTKKQGAHQKSKKAQRRDDKIALKRDLQKDSRSFSTGLFFAC
jgi:hypothetical protein